MASIFLGILLCMLFKYASSSVACNEGFLPYPGMTLRREDEVGVSFECCIKETGSVFQCPTGSRLPCTNSSQNQLSVLASNALLFSRMPRITSDGAAIFFELEADSSGQSFITFGNTSGSIPMTAENFTLTIQRPSMSPDFYLNNIASCIEPTLPCSCPLLGNPAVPTAAVVLSCESGCSPLDQAGTGTYILQGNSTYLRLQSNSTSQALLFLNTTDLRWSDPSVRGTDKERKRARNTTQESAADAHFISFAARP